MTQQPWNRPQQNPHQGGQPQWGRPGPSGQQPQGFGPQGYGQPGPGARGFGNQGFGQQFGHQNFGQQHPQQGGQQQWGAPQGGGGFPSGPKPKKSPLGKVLIAMVALAVVALGGLVLVNALGGVGEEAYQNEDYQVPEATKSIPEIPIPTTEDELITWREDSPIYQQSVPSPVRCELPELDMNNATDEQLDARLEANTACLMRVWEDPMTQAGFELYRPTVTVYADSIQTQCGTSEPNAFYCAADQQLYFSNQLAEYVPALKKPFVTEMVMSHEFGHFLQGRTGIFAAYALDAQNQDESTALELSRRLEVQADCLAGQAVGATAQSLQLTDENMNDIYEGYRAVGDDTLSGDPNVEGNHGHAENRVYWGKIGVENTEVGKCNTFVAPADQVE